MANPYQQQIFQRKLIYIGLIVALLGVSWGFRTYAVEPRAKDLGLVEESRGEVELLGAAARTALTGMRGFAICVLWMEAQEQQKKNQLTSLERTVHQVTRLQPHLVVPWQFMSWNLSYNISRDCDRVADKYFYITRGIQLLAHGEKQNAYQPILRRDVGHFHQHKIGQSDETNTHRSLFQLSCIPPFERDPDSFRDDKGNINLEKLKQFCKDHPQLARRLHSPPLPYNMMKEYPKFRCANAAEFLQFLEDNKDVPSLYVERIESEQDWRNTKRKEDPLDRFPVLPPDRSGKFDPEDFSDEQFVSEKPPDEFDAFHVAKAWYGYAQECLPPPGKYSGTNAPITDRLRQRVPKTMATSIFRSAPPMAQRFIAERLQDEGWFDAEPFLLTSWFQGRGTGDSPVEIGVRRPWSVEAWTKAYQAWRKYGVENKMLFEQEFQRENMERLEKKFIERFDIKGGGPLPEIHPDMLTPEIEEMREAFEFMRNYRGDRFITNFGHFIMRTRIEAQPRTVAARKHFYQAEHLRLVSQALTRALEMYERPEAIAAWRDILEENPAFRADDLIQEQTFEAELRYLRLYRRLNEDKLAPDLALLASLGQASAAAPLGTDWGLLGLFSRPQLQPDFTIAGPLDKDSLGNPFVPQGVKDGVLIRRGLKKSAKPEKKPGATP